AVARIGRAGGEVVRVDVGIGAAAAGAQHGERVARGRRRRRALGAVGGAAEADEVDVVAGAGAAERGGGGHQRDLAGGAAHGDAAGGVRRGQVHGAAVAVGFLDQVVAAGRDAAGQLGDLPAGAGGRGVLHRPAVDADRLHTVVVQ